MKMIRSILLSPFVAFWKWIRSFEKQDPETAFYPGALEILETPPSPLGRTTALLICTFFVLALLWSIVGRVDIIATAQGKIVPTGRTKIIQPLESGVVKSIHVRDGQSVKKGDVLIEIDTTISEAEKSRLQKELTAAQLDVARLKTSLKIEEEHPEEFFEPPETATQGQIETQRANLVSQVQEITAHLTALDQQIAKEEGNLEAVKATIAKLKKAIPLIKEKLKMRDYLSDKGYGSKLDALTSQQELVEHEQELIVQQGRLKEATASIESLRQQRNQAQAQYTRTNLEALNEAEKKAASFGEQLVQATEKYRLCTLTAPVDGTVQQLAVHTEGGVVTPAQALLAIVPRLMACR